MQLKNMIKWSIIFLIYLPIVYNFELYFQNNENLEYINDKPYQIPLFQERYITIQISSKDFQHDGYFQQNNTIGFKFQIQSSNTKVIEIKKKTSQSMEAQNILLEDLFTCKFFSF